MRAGAFAILVGVWLLSGLFGRDPWKPDEAYTMGLVHSMLRSGDWVVPMLAGEPFMEKPPLFFITGALLARAFGGVLAEHDAARLATALYAAVSFLFVFLAARRLFGREAAVAAVLALMGCLGYLHVARLLVTDNALLAGVAMGIYGLLVCREHARLGGVLLGTGAGIAFLAKGLIGPGMLGLTALAAAAFSQWRTRTYAQALGFAMLALAPWAIVWPLLLFERSPQLFHDWLVVNNFGRFTGSADLGPEHDHWMYLKVLPWFAMPALPLAAWAVWRAWREGDRTVALPVAGALVMLAVLSAACNSRYVYALPMLVPLSILAGAGCRTAPVWLSRGLFWLAAATAALALALLWAGWAALLLGRPAAAVSTLLAFRPGFELRVEALRVALALAITVGALAGYLALSRSALAAPGAWAVTVASVAGVFFTLWLSYQDYGNSYRELVAQLKRHIPAGDECVARRGVGEPQRAMLDYFGAIRMPDEASPQARNCRLVLVQQRPSVRPPTAPQAVALWSGARPGDTAERFWLLSLGENLSPGGTGPAR